MAFTLIQAGTALQFVNESGVATTLTLPTGIAIDSTKPPRFTRYGRYVVMANSVNRPVSIDALGVVRALVPFPPTTMLTLAGSVAGALTGAYKAKQTFVQRDMFGNTISESDFGPAMTTALTVAAKALTPGALNISSDDVSGSNLYRTTAGGETYFLWRQLDGNVQTTVDADDLADLSLDVFAAPTLGTPPDLTLLAEWKGRIWGVSRVEVDTLRFTEPGTMYAWPLDNSLSVPKIGSDTRGVTALLAREESLVIGRRDTIKQVIGTVNADFRVVGLSDITGIESNESMATYKDITYFLGKDGVYTLDANGVVNIAEKGHAKSWFTTDTYFNRARFVNAFGYIDSVKLKYRLHLAAVGSSSEDRWVEYDITDGTWWGPHKTGEFSPTSGIVVADSSDQFTPMIGSASGFLYKDQTTATDGASTGIDFDVDTNFDSRGMPDIEKFWGKLSVLGKVQTTGNIAVTPYVGYITAAAKLAFYYVMSKGRQALGRIGEGQLTRFNFRHTAAGEPVELYGYEIDDVHPLGPSRR